MNYFDLPLPYPVLSRLRYEIILMRKPCFVNLNFQTPMAWSSGLNRAEKKPVRYFARRTFPASYIGPVLLIISIQIEGEAQPKTSTKDILVMGTWAFVYASTVKGNGPISHDSIYTYGIGASDVDYLVRSCGWRTVPF